MNNSGKRQPHIVVTLTIFTALSMLICQSTFLLLTGNNNILHALKWNFIVNFPLCLVLVVIYYRAICSLHSVWRGNAILRIAIDWLATSVVGTAFSLLLRMLVGANFGVLEGFLTFLMWNSVIVLGIELFLYHKSIMEKETQLAQMEREKATWQYEALKNQINPHFLFNSLNAIASLAYQDAEKTNRFAKKLSSVYRYLLTTYDKPLVTLDEELSFLHSYLYLEKIRFGEAMEVHTDISQQATGKLIVPVSLQLLVENALKHNVATTAHPLRISISTIGNTIVVENTLQPRNEVASNKLGLDNLRRQYQAHDKQVKITRSSNHFTVELPLM